MEITINHISLRAKSSLNTSSDTCAICRENVCDGCIKCQQANEIADNTQIKKCFSVLGVCGHTYHYCCIQNCISTQSYGGKKCPMCSKTWEMKKRTIQQTDTKFKKILKTEKNNWQNNQLAGQGNNQNNQNNQNNNVIISDDDDDDDDDDISDDDN